MQEAFSLAFVLYKDLNINALKILDDFEKRWDEKLPLEFKVDTLRGNYHQFQVVISFVDTPIDVTEMAKIAQHNPFYQEGQRIAKNHRGHAIVAVKGVSSAVERFRVLTKILAAVASSYNAVAIYQGASQLFYSRDFLLEQARLLQEGYLPVQAWIYFGFYSHENAFWCYTQGMGQFGREELEIASDRHTPRQLHEALIQFAYHYLSSHRQWNDGELVVLNEELNLIVHPRYSPTLKSDTLLLSFDS